MAELKESIQKRILESLSMVLTGKALDQLKNQILDTGECVSLTNQDKDLGNHFKLYILQNDSYNFLFDIYFFHQGSPQIEKENTLHAFQALRSITLSQSTSIAFLKHFIDFYLQHHPLHSNPFSSLLKASDGNLKNLLNFLILSLINNSNMKMSKIIII